MSKPQVTIAVSPREHFSFTQINLESIYAQTRTPFKLIYVDGGSPRHIAEYLETQATEKDFRLIRVEHYLSGNQARNLGLREVDTEYVAFVDNDVVVTPGWLESLVQCAEETSAWLVGPVYCIGKIEDQIIHIAGGDAHIEEDPTGIRRLIETHPYCDQRLEDVRPHLRREPCEHVEFHCMLARSEVFKRIGPLDEALMGTRDNIDICLSVRQAGGTVYYEPKVVVNQLFPPPFAPWDVPYFLLRWIGTPWKGVAPSEAKPVPTRIVTTH